MRRGWRGRRKRVGVQGGIGYPRLTGSFEMSLHRSPSAPNHKTIESSDDKNEANNDVGSISSDIHQVLFKFVDAGGVEVITEFKSILSRNGETRSIEGEVIKSMIDSLFQELKRSVDTGIKKNNRLSLA